MPTEYTESNNTTEKIFRQLQSHFLIFFCLRPASSSILILTTRHKRPKLLRKLKMAATQSQWQKSLRQSMAPVQKVKDSKVDKRRTECLKLIATDEDVFDENVSILKKNLPERGRRREHCWFEC